MKNSSLYEKRFKTLLGRLRKAYAPPPPAQLPTDPVTEMIWSALLEDSSEGTAKVGMSRLTSHYVDFNELRVSRPEEIAESLPNTMTDARPRATRLTRWLQVVFDKFDTLDIRELREQSKRDARNFVAGLPEMTAFVEGRLCLMALNIHAIPVDRALVTILRDREAAHPEADPRDAQGFLERVVPAKDAVEVAMLLEALRQDPSKIPASYKPPKAAAAKVQKIDKPGKPKPTKPAKAPLARKSPPNRKA